MPPALLDNRPTVAKVRQRLLGIDLAPFGDSTAVDAVLQDFLNTSIAMVEDKAGTYFNGRLIHENRDGNGTNELALYRRPVTSCSLVKVELPVLALTRTYTTDEIKLYRLQGRIGVFTYKLLAEQASLHLDQQIYGNIFPTLPLSVFIDYTAGFPRVDSDTAPTLTSLDGGNVVNGSSVLTGDQREPREQNWLRELQTAAACDAAAAFLGEVAANPVGFVTSVSFDGFSKSFNPQAYAQQIQTNMERRDELLAPRKRLFGLTVGG